MDLRKSNLVGQMVLFRSLIRALRLSCGTANRGLKAVMKSLTDFVNLAAGQAPGNQLWAPVFISIRSATMWLCNQISTPVFVNVRSATMWLCNQILTPVLSAPAVHATMWLCNQISTPVLSAPGVQPMWLCNQILTPVFANVRSATMC